MVPGTGIEPVWYRYRRILSPVRLPVPPLGHIKLVSRRRFELLTPWLKVKCSTDWANGRNAGWGGWDRTTAMSESKSDALPLGYTPSMVEGGRFELPNPKELIYSQPRLASSLPLRVIVLRKWWMLRGSNPRPPPCKGDALPAELSIRFSAIRLNNIALWHISVNQKNAHFFERFSFIKLDIV